MDAVVSARTARPSNVSRAPRSASVAGPSTRQRPANDRQIRRRGPSAVRLSNSGSARSDHHRFSSNQRRVQLVKQGSGQPGHHSRIPAGWCRDVQQQQPERQERSRRHVVAPGARLVQPAPGEVADGGLRRLRAELQRRLGQRGQRTDRLDRVGYPEQDQAGEQPLHMLTPAGRAGSALGVVHHRPARQRQHFTRHEWQILGQPGRHQQPLDPLPVLVDVLPVVQGSQLQHHRGVQPGTGPVPERQLRGFQAVEEPGQLRTGRHQRPPDQRRSGLVPRPARCVATRSAPIHHAMPRLWARARPGDTHIPEGAWPGLAGDDGRRECDLRTNSAAR